MSIFVFFTILAFSLGCVVFCVFNTIQWKKKYLKAKEELDNKSKDTKSDDKELRNEHFRLLQSSNNSTFIDFKDVQDYKDNMLRMIPGVSDCIAFDKHHYLIAFSSYYKSNEIDLKDVEKALIELMRKVGK